MLDAIAKQMATAVPFVATVGIEILTLEAGHAATGLVQQERVSNHIGSLHAGALFTLGETASGAAMSGAFASRLAGVRPIATGASIRYTRVARGRIVARATVTSPAETLLRTLDEEGRVAFDVDVVMHDEADVAVAAMTVGWLVSRR